MLREISMRQMFKILLLLICLIGLNTPSYSALRGNLEYKIPIDYDKLSKEELDNKADFYYNLALKTSNGTLNKEMSYALNFNSVLSHKCPNIQFYKIRLGILYDEIGKDKYAKSYFNHAIGMDSNKPEPYFRLGEFYYKRNLYKKALKPYKEAYKKGYSTHYETLYKIGDIYEKFGDTEAALKYLKLASGQSPNERLNKKIIKIENFNKINREYYSDSRIRLQER